MKRVVGDIELLAEKLNTIRREGKSEIGEKVEEMTTDLSARIIRSASSEAATQDHKIGELGESIKVVASRVDGLQDYVARCKFDSAKLRPLFSELHRSLGDKVNREDSKAESRRVDSSLQDLREQLRSIGDWVRKRHRQGSERENY